MTNKKYEPIESDEHKGWYIPSGYEYFLVNRKGELMNAKTGYITSGSADDRGYLRACIWNNKDETKQDVKVHRVVCTAFHGPCPSDKHEVGHKDDDRANNKPSNLYWTTRKENMKKQHTQQAYVNW